MTGLAQANARELPIAAESVDLIFTDPPYAKAALSTYEWLAQEAARVLKPSGFVLAMCGGNYNGLIHKYFMDAGLTCFFDIAVVMESGKEAAYLWHIGVLVRAKFILSYSKGDSKLRENGMHNMFLGRRDKQWHAWGQAIEHARYYIDYFSAPGDLVLDPFIGGGTTAAACELIGRRWLAFDLDPVALRTTRARMAETEFPRTLPLFARLPA